MENSDARLARLVSFAGQKFLTDILTDAMLHWRIANGQPSGLLGPHGVGTTTASTVNATTPSTPTTAASTTSNGTTTLASTTLQSSACSGLRSILFFKRHYRIFFV